ncbi:MAG TPA: YciI family protein [Vicinamibacteria bacterium]|jgi:uncharacterized protein|nr:YciI family protein [Vicinamibacteria bacterium]
MKKLIVAAMLAAGVAALSSGEQAGPGPAAPAAAPSNMEQVFLVLLKKGPKSGTGDSPERKAIQEGHMANMRAMWQARKLVIAGPMGDEGDLRGIFVFRVPRLEDAQALVASDPAVKAGRLVGEIHPWWIEKGTLPEAGEYCAPRP